MCVLHVSCCRLSNLGDINDAYLVTYLYYSRQIYVCPGRTGFAARKHFSAQNVLKLIYGHRDI